MLVDTGTHEPGSIAHLERALDQVGLRLEHVRLVVCTHAHADHCGQAHPIAERAGCEVWAHPNHEHFSAYADDPDAAHARRVEIARQSGVPRDPPRSRAAAGRRAAAARPRPAARASTSRPTSAPGRCTRRPATRRRTSCLFQPERRLLLSGDHLLGRVSLYFDYGWTPDPVGEFLSSLDTIEALGARLALSGHGRPFADVAEHAEANRRLVAAAARRGAGRRSRTARRPPTTSRRAVYGEAFTPDVGGLAADQAALLPDPPRGAPARSSAWRGSPSAGLAL